MEQIEFLLEEASMAEVLKIILPKILPDGWQLYNNVFLRVHEGKSDLQKSIPKKFKAYSHFTPKVGVIIMHDQDSFDCKSLKNVLTDLCRQPGVEIPFLIRIVCRELESWYLGDMPAIEAAYPNFKSEKFMKKSKFRNPDTCNAKDELRKILPELQQIGSAQAISPHLKIGDNRSESFNQFISGLIRFMNTIN